MGLGNSLVNSPMRAPLPAARMTAFISATEGHGWTRMKNKILAADETQIAERGKINRVDADAQGAKSKRDSFDAAKQ